MEGVVTKTLITRVIAQIEKTNLGARLGISTRPTALTQGQSSLSSPVSSVSLRILLGRIEIVYFHELGRPIFASFCDLVIRCPKFSNRNIFSIWCSFPYIFRIYRKQRYRADLYRGKYFNWKMRFRFVFFSTNPPLRDLFFASFLLFRILTHFFRV